MKTAIYPGSFDPVTLSDLDIIKRSCVCFDRLIVCVTPGSDGRSLFTPDERAEMVRRVVRKLPNVEVDCFSGILSEYARGKKACTLIKGLRAVSDYEKEVQAAMMNRKLNPRLETMFLAFSPKYSELDSVVVREIAFYGRDLSDFVPREIIEDVNARVAEMRKR